MSSEVPTSRLFLSTLPARGATQDVDELADRIVQFLSTLPARGATGRSVHRGLDFVISIHAPREGSDKIVYDCLLDANISIHAPREGSDVFDGSEDETWKAISIHAPREGSDAVTSCLPRLSQLFLSTLPARGATLFPAFFHRIADISIHAPREGSDGPAASGSRSGRYFYPRSPRGERPAAACLAPSTSAISIHAPREGSDAVR